MKMLVLLSLMAWLAGAFSGVESLPGEQAGQFVEAPQFATSSKDSKELHLSGVSAIQFHTVQEQDVAVETASVTFTKEAVGGPVKPGDRIDYTITAVVFQAASPVTITVIDDLPNMLTLNASSVKADQGNATVSGNQVTWEWVAPALGLPIPIPGTLTFSGTVKDNVQSEGRIRNVADVEICQRKCDDGTISVNSPVAKLNQPPMIERIAARNPHQLSQSRMVMVNVGETLVLDVRAIDPDVEGEIVDTVTLAARRLPSNSTFTDKNNRTPIQNNPAEGVLRFAPDASQANQTIELIFDATDSGGLMDSKTVTIQVKQPVIPITVSGFKFHDLNRNARWDGNPATPTIPGNEPPLKDWTITLTSADSDETRTTRTDENGKFEFQITQPGSYTVTEENREGWEAITQSSATFEVQLFMGETLIDILIGNALMHLDLSIFDLQGAEIGNDETGMIEQEASVGSASCVNNDNDDQSGKLDSDEGQTLVPNENDLVKLVIAKPEGISNTRSVRLTMTNSGTGRVKLWVSPNRGREETLTEPVDGQPNSVAKTYTVNQFPKVLWIEGITASQQSQDIKFKLEAVDFESHPDLVSMTVIGASAVFLGKGNSVNGDDSLDGNNHPENQEGLRMFPGAQTVDGPVFNHVDVLIKLSAVTPQPITIYVRPFDVDDPSADKAPLDPNDEGLEGRYLHPVGLNPENLTGIRYTLHEDNRGIARGFKSGYFLENRDIDVREETDPREVHYTLAEALFDINEVQQTLAFRVTMQPGDNFKLGVSCSAQFLDDAVNRDDQGHGIDIKNIHTNQKIPWQSDMLTVWRRLHIEEDSMVGPRPLRWEITPNQNTVQGRIVSTVPHTDASGNTFTILRIDQILRDKNQYVFGEIFVSSDGGTTFGQSFTVRRTTSGPVPNFVTISGAVTGLRGNLFRMHDDDEDTVLPISAKSNRVMALMEDIDDIQSNSFSAAFIRPTHDGAGGTNESNITLDLNSTWDEVNTTAFHSNRQSSNLNHYWSLYFFHIFQGPLLEDSDPGSQGSDFLGACTDAFPTGDLCSEALVLVHEDYWDACGNIVGIFASAVHEAGHAFGGRHTRPIIPNSSTILGPGFFDDGVMNQGCNKSSNQFTDITLNRIRNAQRPGAGPF